MDHLHNPENDRLWREFVVNGIEGFKVMRKVLGVLPANPRCRLCNAPFEGAGGVLSRFVLRKDRSRLNPQLCNACETHAATHPGGVEAEISMLFADIRGSTGLAEKMNTTDYTRLISRFYGAATDALMKADGMIGRFAGDAVIAFFLPGLAGKYHAHKAIDGAKRLLEATGNAGGSEPWIPVGVGIHTGVVYMGAVGGGQTGGDLTALGDPVNVTARLASEAAAGEILASDELCSAAHVDGEGLEHRDLALKGREERVGVRVLRV